MRRDHVDAMAPCTFGVDYRLVFGAVRVVRVAGRTRSVIGRDGCYHRGVAAVVARAAHQPEASVLYRERTHVTWRACGNRMVRLRDEVVCGRSRCVDTVSAMAVLARHTEELNHAVPPPEEASLLWHAAQSSIGCSAGYVGWHVQQSDCTGMAL